MVKARNRVFILVGGKGTRLSSVFADIPKPLVPINGIPFLEYIIRDLIVAGVDDIILLAGYMADKIKDYVEKSPHREKIRVVVEGSALGSAGALVNAVAELSIEDTGFLILNGDTYLSAEISPILDATVDEKNALVIAASYKADGSRYGLLELDGLQNISNFSEKKSGTSGWVSTGVCKVHRSLLTGLDRGRFYSLEEHVYPNANFARAIKLAGDFTDIGIPSSFAKFNAEMVFREAQQKGGCLFNLLRADFLGGRVGYLDRLPDFFQQTPWIPSFFVESDDVQKLRFMDLLVTTSDQVQEFQESSAADVVSFDTFESLSYVDYLDLREKLKLSKKHLGHFGELSRPCLFLDRDGVIIEYVDYISKANQVRLATGAAALISEANRRGVSVVCVTNQSGIGRGRFDLADFEMVNRQMKILLSAEGAWVDHVEFAPYFEGSQVFAGMIGPGLRKPRPGMVLTARHSLSLDVGRSILVGDSVTDLIAAANSGIKNLYLVHNPAFQQEREKCESWLASRNDSKAIRITYLNTLADLSLPNL